MNGGFYPPLMSMITPEVKSGLCAKRRRRVCVFVGCLRQQSGAGRTDAGPPLRSYLSAAGGPNVWKIFDLTFLASLLVTMKRGGNVWSRAELSGGSSRGGTLRTKTGPRPDRTSSASRKHTRVHVPPASRDEMVETFKTAEADVDVIPGDWGPPAQI